ncbi:hypothetical protein PMAYCL1PPCAC_24601 [Pristionchus mayeri]|uniref:Uncharacterized protein n=1 Tax=Pristionchus mayeri TaxID=1317129 RepID=A0AAN5I8Q8_9BILA|nr:hypothetical protein PMAYCL1PPCAC_24601 [Pristionchus mayeri]
MSIFGRGGSRPSSKRLLRAVDQPRQEVMFQTFGDLFDLEVVIVELSGVDGDTSLRESQVLESLSPRDGVLSEFPAQCKSLRSAQLLTVV